MFVAANLSVMAIENCCSGTQLLCGHGTSSSITAQSAETTLWTCASSARQIKRRQLVKNAPSRGAFVM